MKLHDISSTLLFAVGLLVFTVPGQSLIAKAADDDIEGSQFFKIVEERRLTIEQWSGNPVWSPDGSQIAYVYSNQRLRSPGTGGDIWVMNIDGMDKRALTTDGLDNRYPSWSPSGQQITFSSARTGKYEIWSMWSDGSHQRQLTSHRRLNTLPVWSPKGDRIIFASSRSGGTALWMVKPDGTDLTQVTPEGGGPGSYYAAWSTDGTMLAFSSTKTSTLTLWDRLASTLNGHDPLLHDLANPERNVTEHLRLFDLKSGDLSQLTWGESVNHRPAWRPDGLRIAIQSNAPSGSTI